MDQNFIDGFEKAAAIKPSDVWHAVVKRIRNHGSFAQKTMASKRFTSNHGDINKNVFYEGLYKAKTKSAKKEYLTNYVKKVQTETPKRDSVIKRLKKAKLDRANK